MAPHLERLRLLFDMAPKTEAELALQRKYEELRKKKVQPEQHGRWMHKFARAAESTPVFESPTALKT